MPIKTVYIFLMILVICIAMATGYSMFSTQLTINGTATAKYEETDIEIPSVGTDENGVTRFTGGSEFTTQLLGIEVFRVVSETAVGNTITTNLQTINDSIFGISLSTNAKITLNIENNSGYEFTNGEIILLESNNDAAFTQRNQTLNKVTVANGDTATVTITGKMAGSSITVGTRYKYQISFDVNGEKQYFYYIINVEPKA